MTWRMVLCGAAAIWAQAAAAQQPACRLYQVEPSSLNVSQEPRSDSSFIDVLDKADVVCVMREQRVAGNVWGFIDYKVLGRGERRKVEGWANMRMLQSAEEKNPPQQATPAAPASRPSSSSAMSSDIRYNQPLPSGPFPIKGSSLEQLARGTPTFPPIEGLPEAVWKKPCGACHNWDRTTLCKQGQSYADDPKMALRRPHPYGGPEKVAMMDWAKSGCR